MLNNPQIQRMLDKLKQLEVTLEPYVFQKQDSLSVTKYETKEQLDAPPSSSLYSKCFSGDKWGAERSYCWFNTDYTVPVHLAGKPLYIYPRFGGYEAMLFVDRVPFGTFAYKITPTGHGNHYCDMLKLNPVANERIGIDIEGYAGHYVIGCFPFDTNPVKSFEYTFESIDICTKNQDIADFIFDLRALNQLAATMDEYSFRRGDIINCLTEVHKTVYYSPDHQSEEIWREALKTARNIMKPCLDAKNSASAPEVSVVGHSHMDTAWLWDISETVKKCARTFANQLNLMEQYPEYRFVQSSAYHLEMIRKHYPALFERIGKAIKSGRYEPNGGVYVECDCNITSGESMIRQFLWGQRYTQKYFDFTSDCFWLPDTFGYSAAIPQIMKGCNVDYFLTTKLSWNDTTKFPYETFNWEGIDGTKVLVHFNTTHNWPDPETLISRTEGRGKVNDLQQKSVSKQRLFSYGLGDGGGGPQFEQIEMARRCRDLEGCPKAKHSSVSDFMKDLDKNVKSPNTYAGELYLELHRGTLTNQHDIKYNNRKAEISLRTLELLTVANAVKSREIACDDDYRNLQETLLINQFHDILPGTCIQTAHEQSHREMTGVLLKSAKLIADATSNEGDKNKISIINTLPFEVDDVIYIDDNGCLDTADSVYQQRVTDIHGNKKIAVVGLKLAPLSSYIVQYGKKDETAKTNFTYENNKVTTKFAEIVFNEKGYIKSYIDLSNGRQLVKDGGLLNRLIMAEDVPSQWDNWDIDADCLMKFNDSAILLNEDVVSSGAAQLRIRREYKLTDLSTVRQDMIFNAHTPRIDFETEIHWHDKRRFLKAEFDTTILARQARHEIQFGYVNKPTTRNTEQEQSMFEVVNHKYTDISETQYGCSILNDCKYGISVDGGKMGLSLHKGGIRPDPRGDEGVHSVTYSFLPHSGQFSTETVIKPAYVANYKPLIVVGEYELPTLLTTSAQNVILEAVKPCEDSEQAFIARLYEAEGTYASTTLNIGFAVKKAYITNMLEEVISELDITKPLTFKPFEIKTIKLCY